MRKLEMIGRTFGDWEVVEEVQKRNNKRAFLCRCRCGKKFVVMGDNLRNRISTQCMSCSSKIKGKKHATHGMTDTRIFNLWHGMLERCRNPHHNSYKNYGAKGIKVCTRWEESFEAFLADMGEPPTTKHQLDRYPDQKGNYEPGNVRWVTSKEQNNNRSNNVLITFQGEIHSIAEWAELLGVGSGILYWRVAAGWPVHKVLSTPINSPTQKRKPTQAA